jgi:hypothetical protein
MQAQLVHGPETFSVMIDESRVDVRVARSANPAVTDDWEAVVGEAMANPIDAAPIAEQDLRNKSVAIVTDDWGRPTPAYRVVPLILDALAHTGVADEDITFVTASGMHDPMSRDGLARKLGEDVVAQYRCISHDGGDWDMLKYVGLSSMGTPVWVNRYVALHATHGYEGGYKLILPGVVGFDTILRDHGLNFSPHSVPGVHENPSRAETDNVGHMVGFDFLINVVVNHRALPCVAYAGAVEPVHERAIAYGDREIWGATIERPADITLLSAGPGDLPSAGFDAESVRRACTVTQPGGTVIVLAGHPVALTLGWRGGEMADDAALDALSRAEFGPRLRALAFSELMRMHERRDWPLSLREIQWRVKALRGEFYRRRWMMEAERRNLVFTQDLQGALDAAIAAFSGKPNVLILPEGRTTMPKLKSTP